MNLKARARFGGSGFSHNPLSYGVAIEGLRKRRNMALASAPVPLSWNRCETTWYRQWQTLFNCGGNLKNRKLLWWEIHANKTTDNNLLRV